MKINYSGKNDRGSGSYSSPSTHAHNVDLNISFNPTTQTVVCRVTPQTKAGAAPQPALLEEPSRSIQEIEISACGGKGSPGHRGMDGRAGSDGCNGRNATEYSAGTNGEDGGRGTDGQPGTSGGKGGDGGDVVIRIAEANTDLLALLQVNNAGGEGGDPGSHGRGGPGGMPGRGGKAYSWTTSHQVPVQKSRWEQETKYYGIRPIGTMDGPTQGSWVESKIVYYTDYETRYEEHTQPGGRDGRHGDSGRTPSSPLFQGEPGRDGTLTIHVQTDAGVKSYRGPFDLKLVSFKAAASLNNGIYEPGDTVEISDITIKNDGAMPSPDGKRIKIFLRQGNWFVCEPQELYLLGSIPPGQSVTIQGTMKFQIKECAGQAQTAYRKSELLDLGAAPSRLSTNLRRFTQEQKLVISHPLEFSKVSLPSSLLPGEVTKISIAVKNISKKAIGADALDQELQRSMKVTFGIKSDTQSAGYLVFCDEKGVPQRNATIECSISSIAPGQTATVSCHVKLLQSHQNHQVHEVCAKLFLEKIGGSSSLKQIQSETIAIKEGIEYRPNVKDDFLLVTNLSTTNEELAAWRDIASSLGLSFSIWDMPVHGHLDLRRQSGNGSLHYDWRNKLVVLLNQRSTVGSNTTIMGQMLSASDLDTALRINNTKIYAVGHLQPFTDQPSIAPSVPIQKRQSFSSVTSFMDSFQYEAPATSTECTIFVARHTHPFSCPPKEYFDEECRVIAIHLKDCFPKHVFTITPHYSVVTKTRYPFTGIKHDMLGTIVIRSEEIAPDSLMIGTLVDEARAHSPAFIKSKINTASLIAAMPNSQLAGVVVAFLKRQTSNQDALEAIGGGLLKKIILEADQAEACGDARSFRDASLLDTFTKLFVAEMGNLSHPDVKSCAWLMAHMEHSGLHRISFWQALLVFSPRSRIVDTFQQRVATMEKHLRRVLDKEEATLYSQVKKETLSALQKEFGRKSRKEFEIHLTQGDSSQQTGASSWTINPYLTTDERASRIGG